LAHLHGLRIVHRDLKPVNILFFVPLSEENECKSPIIKLADFGRSKITDEEHTETSNRAILIKTNKPMEMIRNDLKEPYSSENNEAFDLIKSMLVINPDKRPTVNEITNSPFFPVKNL